MGLRDVFTGAEQMGREHREGEHGEQLEQRQRSGQEGACGHAAMAKSQALGPDARVQVPSAPLKHQLTSGNSCDPVLPYFPQQ